jgi:hypothetical protein
MAVSADEASARLRPRETDEAVLKGLTPREWEIVENVLAREAQARAGLCHASSRRGRRSVKVSNGAKSPSGPTTS